MKHLATILDTPVYYDGADIFINVDGQLTRNGYLDADITGVLAVTDTSLLIASADNTVWCLTRYGSKWLFGRPRPERVQRILDEWDTHADTGLTSDNQPGPTAIQTCTPSIPQQLSEPESYNSDMAAPAESTGFLYFGLFLYFCSVNSRTNHSPRVTASVVTYRQPEGELPQILRALADEPDCAGVAVADNASDNTVRAECLEFNALWLPGVNNGYGSGHNRAFAALNPARYHLVINTDIEFERGLLTTLADYMDTHPDVMMVQPRIIYPDGTDQHCARMLPTPFDLLLRRFLPGWIMPRSRQRYLLADIPPDIRHIDVAYLQGSFMLVRRDAWSQTGGFDERFFMYPEDIDLSRRLSRLGAVRQLRTLSVVHNHRRASYGSLRMLVIHMTNMVRYFNKYGWLFDSERRLLNRRVRRAVQNQAIDT